MTVLILTLYKIGDIISIHSGGLSVFITENSAVEGNMKTKG